MKAIIKVANTAANPNQELFVERIYFSFVNYQIMFETTPHQTLAMVFDTIENATALTEYFRSTGSGLYEMKDIVVIPTPEEKDIEKRASARYPYADDIDADPNSWAAKKACIEMAKEQQEIDIQRAVEYIRDLAFVPTKNMNIICEKLIKAMKGGTKFRLRLYADWYTNRAKEIHW